MANTPVNIFWFRRDLRLHDNAGLYRALRSGNPVLPIFIFDKNILDDLEDKQDARVSFIYDTIVELDSRLREMGSHLLVFHDTPDAVFGSLLNTEKIGTVFCNEDYEPYARERDDRIASFLKAHQAEFLSFKDQVIFSKSEVLKDDGKPYTVFTPYSRKWKALINPFFESSYPVEKYYNAFIREAGKPVPTLDSLGFQRSDQQIPSQRVPEDIIAEYDKTRDFPGINGTSRMGLHLRFGTISIRELMRKSKSLNHVYTNELIWREFYQMILWHFPHVGKGLAFKPDYDKIRWRNNQAEFEAWCQGRTGYPLVDAGMRQLNETGFMHNRVRMVTASFLAKHLLIDWRWGEEYFAVKLLDFDLAPNNGGWQWAAGSGCDAAPFFRIFNPALQAKRFDKDGSYVRTWVPEYGTAAYPEPIVDHNSARERCLSVYRAALSPAS